MMNKQVLTIEIGTEELPPTSLKALAQAFSANVSAHLNKLQIYFDEIDWYATPKRLALSLRGCDTKQPDQIIEKRGPAVKVAFDNQGQPTQAALGWASANGIEIADAERHVTAKGEWLLFKKHQSGKALQDILGGVIEQSLQALPISKPMRWGDGDCEFVRPIHNVTILLGDAVISCRVMNMDSSNLVRGHRFHSPNFFQLSNASDYVSSLHCRYVQADYEQRKADIRSGLMAAADKLHAIAQIDEALLDEVTALVEWPVIMSASFEEHFLAVPKEALMYTMKQDQRYFPLLSQDGALLANFLFVANIASTAPDTVIKGNERVIRPRLADAQFFYETDLKLPFDELAAKLQSLVFEKQLGTVLERTIRIASLAKTIAPAIGADPEQAHTAGLLCKHDLVTNMVQEFPALQGVMGKYYAAAAGYSDTVANAIYEHYLPAFSGDSLPKSPVGTCVALAEKLDTLVGIFATGQKPKGDKDPFALRRAAIGILRICREKQLPLGMDWLAEHSAGLLQDKFSNNIQTDDVVSFLFSRLKSIYTEEGYDNKVVQAVMATGKTVVTDIDGRMQAVAQFMDHTSAVFLVDANKRVANFLKKSAQSELDPSQLAISSDYFEHVCESDLLLAMTKVESEVVALSRDGQFQAALDQLAGLKQVIDDFFTNVMVNADDEQVRRNRLAMLWRLRTLFLNIADISLVN